MEGYRSSWKVVEGHGKSFPETRLNFQVRNVIGWWWWSYSAAFFPIHLGLVKGKIISPESGNVDGIANR